VEVLLNGNRLGEVAGNGPLSKDFVVPTKVFLTGAENELAFKTPDNVGVLVQSVEFDPFVAP
jgi:hypothetical protein